ncbi:choline dehydrogenase, mitochondrial-like isoform X2 [Mytilus californianus]|nr:choline dehydrogenase, mitochondrial-like isoform X2 [Mytilus californianus]
MEIGFSTVDCNSDNPIGFCKSQTNIKDGKRCSTSTCYLRPVLQRFNLQVSLRSHVTKVLIRNNKAVGVEFVKDGKKRLVFAKHEVILSAGVIGSAQILMLSGVGPRRHLQQMKIPLTVDLPVGQNLYDHLNFIVQYNITAPLNINNKKAAEPDRILDYIVNREGIYSKNGAEGSILQNVNPLDTRGPQIELQLSNVAYEEGFVLDPNLAFKNEIVKEHLKRVDQNSFVVVMFLLQPRSKGYLRLSSKSPFTYPVINPRYLSHPEDIEDFVKGIRLMRSLEQTEAWKSIGATLVRQDVPGHCSEEIYDSDNYWRCIGRHFLRSAYHFIGTCRMGSVDDPSVVVDSRLRVIGIDKLRVVDASVMRYIPSGHTNAPAMMIGEKAADMIKRDKLLDIHLNL